MGVCNQIKVVCLGVAICSSFVSGAPRLHDVKDEALTRHVSKYHPISFEGLHEQINIHERQRRDLGYGSEQPILFEINVFGRLLEVEVAKTGVHTFGESYSYGPGGKKLIDTSDIPVMTGRVVGVEDSKVEGRIFDGIFEGMIHTPQETYHVEKAAKFLKNPEFDAVAYKWSDIDFEVPDGSHVCGQQAHTMLRDMHARLETGHSSAGQLARKRRQESAVSPTSNTCLVKLVADHLFFAFSGGSAQAIASMSNALTHVNEIYESTPFYSSTSGVTVQLASKGFIVWDSTPNPVSNAGPLVNETLLEFSNVNWDEVCVAHLFTYQDYGGGTLGLAWVGDVAQDGKAGGICQKQAYCGDGVKDNEEECDCGGAESGVTSPECTCCTEDCKLVSQCDPRHDDCCTETCDYAPSESVCRAEGECKAAALCPGDGPKCPVSESKAADTKCGNDAFVCLDDGVCSRTIESSVCNLYNADFCEIVDKECAVSCQFNGVCLTTQDAETQGMEGNNGTIPGAYYPGGYPCFSTTGNYEGQCNEEGKCEKLVRQDALDTVSEFFSSGNVYNISHYIQDSWYWFAVGALLLASATVLVWWLTRRELPKLIALEASQVRTRKVKDVDGDEKPKGESDRDEIKRLKELYAKEKDRRESEAGTST
ncbi:hypothetical protein SARC_02792 [Sphaeroforma arctica JP610]|uniref:Disintegrin domain-containing protein n=1 Tax=Sphaeroforma arctica JP610 TaxID=667725 RepID=A0A0L0G9R5_9EUKA|nr:hypothetical protein SARC_02792 [Sphaeroforma arctica JP610]KNC85003.1 hypothetical protein SARC_02792 [Sphaeroforma arctica JP610]|eukprot:XP_014158905.1 hypothetical protein SARC_02792 [Sphaeroforma arctica JP610]